MIIYNFLPALTDLLSDERRKSDEVNVSLAAKEMFLEIETELADLLMKRKELRWR